MSTIELLFLSAGLSMDAFAVAVCIGLTLQKATMVSAIPVGLYFGGFQGMMPLIGFMAANLFAHRIVAYDHWIAFVLLSVLGCKMLAAGLKNEDDCCPCPASLKPADMLPLALATSIDALAVGVSFAFIHISILPAVATIGVVTCGLSMLGVYAGCALGSKLKNKAEMAGGAILVLIGIKLLAEGLIG